VPAARSSSSSGRSKSSGTRKQGAGSKGASTRRRPPAAPASSARGVADGLATLAEQLANRILTPLDAVLLTRERIQETLEEAAEGGRITRSDANDLVAELLSRGRQQTDDLLGGRFGAATKRARKIESVDRIVRGADRARRSVGVGPSFPILGYDDLTAGQVQSRLAGLSPADLRRVRDYERRHANRKSVLAAIERALA
jgi:polyhydroxyalkanoate synthesis regulator phasin